MSIRSPGPGQVGPAGTAGTNGTNGTNGAPGTNGTNGTQGPAGIVPMFNSSGPMSGVKCWMGTATTGSNGQWSVNFSSAGFIQPPNVQPTPVSTGLTAALAVGTTMTAATTTGVSGACFLPNAISLLGVLPLQQAGAGIVVQVIAIGV